jgi:hypothetical protein
MRPCPEQAHKKVWNLGNGDLLYHDTHRIAMGADDFLPLGMYH